VKLFAITSLTDCGPSATFLLADDADEALSRTTTVGRVTHVVPICPANLKSLRRNGLLLACPPADLARFIVQELLKFSRGYRRNLRRVKKIVANLIKHLESQK
jgi:hypothetical protein